MFFTLHTIKIELPLKIDPQTKYDKHTVTLLFLLYLNCLIGYKFIHILHLFKFVAKKQAIEVRMRFAVTRGFLIFKEINSIFF